METRYIIIIGGLVLFLILTFQVLSGLRIIKITYNWHKAGGLLLFTFAIFHLIIGVIYLIK